MCGDSFETMAPNAKYCSNECRKKGAIVKRIEWIERTDHNERQRIEKAQQRKKERERKRQQALERKRKRDEEMNRKHKKKAIRKHQQLTSRAKAGDPMARMSLAKPFSVEYWEAYRDYEIQNNLKFKKRFIRHVNGISVFDDNFVDKVMILIEEQGKIVSELISAGVQ